MMMVLLIGYWVENMVPLRVIGKLLPWKYVVYSENLFIKREQKVNSSADEAPKLTVETTVSTQG
jgi:hypothetical protein